MNAQTSGRSRLGARPCDPYNTPTPASGGIFNLTLLRIPLRSISHKGRGKVMSSPQRGAEKKSPRFVKTGAYYRSVKYYDNRELTAWWRSTFEEVVDQVDDVTNVDDPVTRDISTNLWARFRTILI